MCCILYTNVIALFVNIKTMPPRCRPSESYLPHNSRNTTLQGEEHGDQNIEDRVLNDPMDEDGVIDTTNKDICYIVVGELEGFEWFIKHLFHTAPKVCNVLIASSHGMKSSIYSSIFSVN